MKQTFNLNNGTTFHVGSGEKLEFPYFEICNSCSDDLDGYVVGRLQLEEDRYEHEFLYRICDPENGRGHVLVSIDYLTERLEKYWDAIERCVYDYIHGLYECSCGTTLISDLPVREVQCVCGETIGRQKYISGMDVNEILRSWEVSQQSCEGGNTDEILQVVQ